MQSFEDTSLKHGNLNILLSQHLDWSNKNKIYKKIPDDPLRPLTFIILVLLILLIIIIFWSIFTYIIFHHKSLNVKRTWVVPLIYYEVRFQVRPIFNSLNQSLVYSSFILMINMRGFCRSICLKLSEIILAFIYKFIYKFSRQFQNNNLIQLWNFLIIYGPFS